MAKGNYGIALEYLKKLLFIQRDIGDRRGESSTLNNISQIYRVKGDFSTALNYLKQSLAITRNIGDKAGECFALFNIGYIHLQNNVPQDALSVWLSVYQMAKPMELAQILVALGDFAPIVGLPPGLEGWEQLSQVQDV